MSKVPVMIIAALLSSGVCHASLVTLTFDELTDVTIPLGGLTQGGVTFTFPAAGTPATEATYGYTMGAATFFTNLTDRVLAGPAAGILTLDFAVPTPYLQFDVGLGISEVLVPGFTVQLSGSGSPTASTAVNTAISVVFSEGRFTYDNTVTGPPGALISQAIVTFNIAGGQFALDNLTYEPPQAIPEPAAACLLGVGLVVLATLRRSRSRRG